MDIESRIREEKLLQSYEEALVFLDGYALVVHPRLRERPRLEQMGLFLEHLNNPQHSLRVLHVAGTSGKGSTSTILARVLQSTGRKVGLVVSPHLMDIRERIQVDGQLISPQRFLEVLNRQIPALHQMLDTGPGLLSYVALLLAMAICFFEEENVEYAVLETGIGGRFDFTNAIQGKDKIAVLTKIGLDHMGFLGDTLPKIAWEKAGIIPEEGEVFAMDQHPDVIEVFEEESRLRSARLVCLHPLTDIHLRSMDEYGTRIDLCTPFRNWENLHLGLIGWHQAENAALALSVFERVVERDGLSYDEMRVREIVRHLSFEGRGEVVHHEGRTIFFDVAHNPQKIEALCSMVHTLWPGVAPCLVTAFGHDAQSEAMLHILRSITSELILTDFIVGEGEYRYKFKELGLLKKIALEEGFASIQCATSAREAWQKALSSQRQILVVTGSLHFVACMKAALLADKKNAI